MEYQEQHPCWRPFALTDAEWVQGYRSWLSGMGNLLQSGNSSQTQVPPATPVLPQGGNGNVPAKVTRLEKGSDWIELQKTHSVLIRGSIWTDSNNWRATIWTSIDNAIFWYQASGRILISAGIDTNDLQCCDPTRSNTVRIYFNGRAHTGDCPQLFSPTKSGCSHEFVEYQGLFEKYQYCQKCDAKRSL